VPMPGAVGGAFLDHVASDECVRESEGVE
jgi:hypothetical protein